MPKTIEELVFGTEENFVKNYSRDNNKRFYVAMGAGDWRVYDKLKSNGFYFNSVIFADLLAVCYAMNSVTFS
jgi:hypothetical protein